METENGFNVFNVYDPEDARQAWTIYINPTSDGRLNGHATYDYYGDRKFLEFSNVESVEFNSFNQTIEQGNTRWAQFAFDPENPDVIRYSQSQILVRDPNDTEYYGTPGDDTLIGEAGRDDWFYGSAGDDTINGGAPSDRDRLDYRDLNASVRVDLQQGTVDKIGSDSGTDTIRTFIA